ncbi:MAG: YeeE/YedE family protein [Hyphomicrobium sp.]
MTDLHDLLQADSAASLAIGGLVIGFGLGLLLERTGFCIMGGVSDWHSFGDTRRLRAWMLAAASAMAGVALLEAGGLVDLSRAMYTAPRLNWAGHVTGGLLFGIGMVLGGGCASRNLVRAGSGDLRSLLALMVIGLFAEIALGGLLGPARAAIEDVTTVQLASSSQRLGSVLGLETTIETGLGVASGAAVTAALASLALALAALAARPFRSSPKHVLSGLGVGLAVTAGWALTGLTYDEMQAKPFNPASLTFVKPTGDTLDWLARSTALGWPGFGAASVIGTLLGAMASSLATRRFRLATFHGTSDTLRTLGGAALMGIGGVMALGCSIGQGVTGLSTLALGSMLSALAIVGGAVMCLKALERWGV